MFGSEWMPIRMGLTTMIYHVYVGNILGMCYNLEWGTCDITYIYTIKEGSVK